MVRNLTNDPCRLSYPQPRPRAAKHPASHDARLVLNSMLATTTYPFILLLHQEVLGEVFAEFGTVYDCYISTDGAAGCSRGFGFVTMDPDDALSNKYLRKRNEQGNIISHNDCTCKWLFCRIRVRRKFDGVGIAGPPQGHFFVDPDTGEVQELTSPYERPQPHTCSIVNVQDDLVNPDGIMDLVTREARLFKYGSGTGTN